MKKNKHIGIFGIFALCASLLTACSSEDQLNPDVADNGKISASTSGYAEEAVSDLTRSNLTYNLTTKGMDFSWESGDQLALFTKLKSNTEVASYSGFFTLEPQFAGKQSGDFDGDLTFETDRDYYAFCPGSQITTTNKDPRKLSLSYLNQTQYGNDNTDHLGDYDYQASFGNVSSDGILHLNFQHLSAILRIKMLMENKNVRYKTLTIKTADASKFSMNRTINLIGDNTVTASNYNPDFDVLSNSTDKAEFSLNLMDADKTTEGILPDEDGLLYMYIAIPAGKELFEKQVYAVLTPVDPTADSYKTPIWTGKEYLKGNCYTIGRAAAKTTDAIIDINVYKKWQNGAASSVTRVDAGDPGNEEVYDKPTNLLLFICKDGKVYEKRPIPNISASDWQDMGDRFYYSPRLKVEFTPAPESSFHVYAVASDQDMTTLIQNYSSINEGANDGTSETDLVKYIYNVPDENRQTFLKNLYSVPYGINGDNGGNGRSDDPSLLSVTCNLYHVAAKVDLNWEGTKSSTLDGFTVSNLPTSGYLFQPTENAVATSGDTYTYNTNTGDKLYGRNYFYAIQQKNSSSQFPLTVSWNPTTFCSMTTVTFTPSFKNGCTSWFKANIGEIK